MAGDFTTGSAFNDIGFTLTPTSMASSNKTAIPQLVMTFLMFAIRPR